MTPKELALFLIVYFDITLQDEIFCPFFEWALQSSKNLWNDSILIFCLMEIFIFLALYINLEADKCDDG